MTWSLQASGSAVPSDAADDTTAAAEQQAAERDLMDALSATFSVARYGTVSAKFAGQYHSGQWPPPPPPPVVAELTPEEQLAAAQAEIDALKAQLAGQGSTS